MIGSAACLLWVLALPGAETPASYKPSEEELSAIRAKTAELGAAIKRLAAHRADPDLLPDVEVYHKAATWIVRYADEEFFEKRSVADALAALDRGLARAKELTTRRASWPKQKGQLVRAYRSRIDDSVQPYGLAIPTSYDGRRPVRLDVVLHGRGNTLNEVSFLAGHDSAKPLPADQDYIRLEVYGRGNNAYRWAGETDVFEAIASVRKRYKIDPRRIVLRGFSMGGAGAWHLGLHYPDRWAAVEAGAGFTDTKRYAKLADPPAYVESTLHIYDAVDYSLNAFNVPTVGYGGEDDAQLQGSTNIREQLTKEGFQFTPHGLDWHTTDLAAVFLVGPKTGHKFHPTSKQQSDQFIQANLPRKPAEPSHLRFVTYTTRYNGCFWLKVAGMEKHYERAEVDARRTAEGQHFDIHTRNVAQLILAGKTAGWALTLDGKEVSLPATARSPAAETLLEKTADGWTAQDLAHAAADPAAPRKTHGLQGPIDDAFGESFLCVRPTGTPRNPAAHEYAKSTLDNFLHEFAKWMRGEARVKDDTEITPDDISNHHLVLFGDPCSNKLLGRIADRLPIRWGEETIAVGGRTYRSAEHVLAMICPNPLNPSRYVVVNSGHTFHEKDFRGTNALLYPRLGDYAVLKLDPKGDTTQATVAEAGLFGEHWELPSKP